MKIYSYDWQQRKLKEEIKIGNNYSTEHLLRVNYATMKKQKNMIHL